MTSGYIKPVTRTLALLLTLNCLLALPLFAQVTTADITGRVLDQQGAAVPNATITARNTATGQTRTTTTGDEGNYTL
ncbi:MAG: carboxypeptidase-like regulatory domain-containing protein, partial [Pyrinomonadaceae bacterium]